ncbi:MAG: hypothetical protein RID09_13805 [Coleofasciculus sp. G1-WW12-02]|uniref:hypothetical protein n=1 Tax=Coleofasciculus sp. G1-WW12-02 TaxID=3068483 RepID=UPI0032F97C2B
MADVNGTWLGTYWQWDVPTRFEATLLHSGNTVTGNILDDSYLGEASLTGEVVGRRISFIKRYLASSNYPISYTGTISESEDFMHGQWSIGGVDSGSWEARRSGENLTVDLQKAQANRVPALTGV